MSLTPAFRSCRRLARGLATLATLAAFCLFAAAAARAQNTIHVPADQPTIQAGINAANTGDTVLVAPGTYYENIDFKGKAITVTSSAGAASTTIDGSKGQMPAVSFTNGEGRASILSGFTVQYGGIELYYGTMAGILLQDTSPTIANNTITHNYCYGIWSSGSSPLIQNNEIDNTLDAGSCSFAGGAAIWLDGSALGLPPVVLGNILQNNTQSGREDAGGNGGAGVAVWTTNAVVENNTIRNNFTHGVGAGIHIEYGGGLILQNLIYNNQSGGGGALDVSGGNGPITTYIANNTIALNTYGGGGSESDDEPVSQVFFGPFVNDGSTIAFVNNIVYGSTNEPAVACGSPDYSANDKAALILDHNIVYNTVGSAYYLCPDPTGTYGNLTADPKFTNAASGNFELTAASPAIDAGNNSINALLTTNKILTPLTLTTDFTSAPRLQDASGKGYPIIDMGAFEFAGVQNANATLLLLTPSVYIASAGTPATLTAKAISSNGTPNGAITFFEDGAAIGTVALDSTATAVQPVTLVPGYHHFVATYPGSGAFTAATSVQTVIVVSNYSVTVAIKSSANPAAVNTPVTLTVTTSSPDHTIPSPITLTDNYGTQLATLQPDATGTATYTTSSLALGYHSITATYAGDAIHNGASASVYQQIINPYATTSTPSGTPNPSIANGSVLITANVASSGGGSPTGTVAFSYGGTNLGSATLVGNSSGNTASTSISTSALPVGYDVIAATYLPTGSFAASSGTYTQQVLSGYPTITALTSSLNPSGVSQPVTFSAHVAAQTSSNGTPTGSVTFTDGATALATQPLDASGNAGYATAALARGSHSIVATYTPTGSFAGSSGSLTQTVNGLPSTSVLSILPATTATYGTPITLTATVSGTTSGVPTGTVTFFVDGISLGAAPLFGPTATFTLTPLGGTHSFTCAYSGDATFNNSTCAAVPFVVLPAASTLALTSSANPSPALAPVTLTASLTSNKAPVVGATVVFTVDGQNTSAITNAAGVAAISPSLAAGSHSLSASYAGDASHTASTAALTQTAVPNPTTTGLIAAPNPAPQNQTVTLAASIHATTGVASPYGTVVLQDSGAPIASTTIPAGQGAGQTASVTFNLSTLAPGTHTLTAVYTPADPNFNASTSAPVSVVITPADAVLSTDTPTLTVQTEHHNHLNVQLTSIGGLTGTFTLSCGTLPAWAHCYFGQNPLVLQPNGAVPVVAPGSFSTATTLEIDTDAIYHFKSALEPPILPGQALPGRTPPSRLPLLALVPLALLPFSRRRRLPGLTALLVLIALAFSTTGCGDKYPDHTEPGTYTVQVTATSVAGTTSLPMTRTATFTLNITP